MPLPLKIIPIYAALLALLFLALSVRTLRLRRRLNISVGDAGNTKMLRAMRAHANFAEYVPLCQQRQPQAVQHPGVAVAVQLDQRQQQQAQWHIFGEIGMGTHRAQHFGIASIADRNIQAAA